MIHVHFSQQKRIAHEQYENCNKVPSAGIIPTCAVVAGSANTPPHRARNRGYSPHSVVPTPSSHSELESINCSGIVDDRTVSTKFRPRARKKTPGLSLLPEVVKAPSSSRSRSTLTPGRRPRDLSDRRSRDSSFSLVPRLPRAP